MEQPKNFRTSVLGLLYDGYNFQFVELSKMQNNNEVFAYNPINISGQYVKKENFNKQFKDGNINLVILWSLYGSEKGATKRRDIFKRNDDLLVDYYLSKFYEKGTVDVKTMVTMQQAVNDYYHGKFLTNRGIKQFMGPVEKALAKQVADPKEAEEV